MQNILREIRKTGLTASLVLLSALPIWAQVSQGRAPKANATAESLIKGTNVVVKVVAFREGMGLPDKYIEPREGNKFVSVQIVFENRGEKEWDLDPDGFEIKDAEGSVYEHNVMNPMVAEPPLKRRVLDGGELVKGWVSFEIIAATSVGSLSLRYESTTGLHPREKSQWIPFSAINK